MTPAKRAKQSTGGTNSAGCPVDTNACVIRKRAPSHIIFDSPADRGNHVTTDHASGPGCGDDISIEDESTGEFSATIGENGSSAEQIAIAGSAGADGVEAAG